MTKIKKTHKIIRLDDINISKRMRKMKIHMGCGKRNWKGWYNVDIAKFNHIHSDDIYLTNIKTNTVDLIYASHFLEYFDEREVIRLLLFWKYALKEGGKIYLSVPDFKKISELYLKGVPLHKFLGPLYGRMESNKKIIYHKTVYDYARLGDLLRFIGFKRIEPWKHSEVEWGKYDDHSHAKIEGELISLNISCEK